MLGSAPHQRAYLLLDLKKPWPRKVKECKDLPEGLSAALKQSPIKVELLARPLPAHGPRRASLYRRHRGATYRCDFEFSPEALSQALSREPEQPAATEIWVCTHGSRDACCARLGVPLLQKARELGYRAVECSHLGGHRFAPVIMAMPWWRCFGRLGAGELGPLLEALEAGQACPEFHRGLGVLPAHGQVLEGELWKRFGSELKGVKLLESEPDQPLMKAWFKNHTRVFQGQVEKSKFEGIGSCRDIDCQLKGLSEYKLLSYAEVETARKA